MPIYQIVPERSRVLIEASSSLHPIKGQASGITGEVDADLDGDGLDLTRQPRMWLELPVEALQSGNVLYDREMLRRVDARRFPQIRGEAREVSVAGPARYRISGDVTFHGQTKTVEGEVAVDLSSPESLSIQGEHVFDVRDFGVEPPKMLGLRVHPEVRIRIELTARRAQE